jgi:hypothetical protein
MKLKILAQVAYVNLWYPESHVHNSPRSAREPCKCAQIWICCVNNPVTSLCTCDGTMRIISLSIGLHYNVPLQCDSEFLLELAFSFQRYAHGYVYFEMSFPNLRITHWSAVRCLMHGSCPRSGLWCKVAYGQEWSNRHSCLNANHVKM